MVVRSNNSVPAPAGTVIAVRRRRVTRQAGGEGFVGKETTVPVLAGGTAWGPRARAGPGSSQNL